MNYNFKKHTDKVNKRRYKGIHVGADTISISASMARELEDDSFGIYTDEENNAIALDSSGKLYRVITKKTKNKFIYFKDASERLGMPAGRYYFKEKVGNRYIFKNN